MKIGDCIVYVDPKGNEHSALITQTWDNNDPEKFPLPSVNLVYVSDDLAEHDQYGRQIKRNTSVPYAKQQAAPGNYWKELD